MQLFFFFLEKKKEKKKNEFDVGDNIDLIMRRFNIEKFLKHPRV